jgi:hypothetical protein
LDPITLFFGLVLIFGALEPTGLLLLRCIEHAHRGRLGFSTLERLILAPYLSVALLYGIAIVPAPVYGLPLVLASIAVGWLVLTVLWIRERGIGLRCALGWLTSRSGAAVILATAGVLLLELWAVAGNSFPNAYDGSFQSTYLVLLLRNHTAPWTLQPIASFGVTYPLGATVWLSLPVLLLGLPIQFSAVALPSFFLSLSIPAAYCWGSRIGGYNTDRGVRWGFAFAGFFGLIASWPRLFIGGSYDFALALPLFFLMLGWLGPFFESGARSWGDSAGFGVLLGVCTSLSLAIGEALVLLMLGYILLERIRSGGRSVRLWLPRLGLILAIGAAFVARSILAVAIWFRYPGHVLEAAGSPPYAPIPGLPSPTYDTFVGNLDPFIPFKWKLSPLPILSLELLVLLVLGLIILGAFWRGFFRLQLSTPFADSVTLGLVSTFLWTLFLILGSGSSFLSPTLDSLASLYESSFLLFFFFEAVALLPLLLALEILVDQRRSGRVSSPEAGSGASGPGDTKGIGRPPPRHRLRPWAVVGLSLLLVVPFAIGSGTTVTQVPGFLSDHLAEFSNVTAADVDALEWAGSHLPPCSVVLVAPGSAAGFLPLYATVHVDFPMMPLSVNGSYNLAVSNLTDGIYTPATQNALTYLGVTEVFVTGQTSVSYAAFDPALLGASPSFELLFHEQDAFLFEFKSTVNSTGCGPD